MLNEKIAVTQLCTKLIMNSKLAFNSFYLSIFIIIIL